MAPVKRNELKKYFVRGKVPTQNQFAELIDSFLNIEDDEFVRSNKEGFAVYSKKDGDSGGVVLEIYKKKPLFNDSDLPFWTLSLDKEGNLLINDKNGKGAKFMNDGTVSIETLNISGTTTTETLGVAKITKKDDKNIKIEGSIEFKIDEALPLKNIDYIKSQYKKISLSANSTVKLLDLPKPNDMLMFEFVVVNISGNDFSHATFQALYSEELSGKTKINVISSNKHPGVNFSFNLEDGRLKLDIDTKSRAACNIIWVLTFIV